MKDEEMADKYTEEYRKNFRYYRVWHGQVVDKSPSTIVEQSFKDGFLAGLKASRPQWHDLRENPTDLPDDTYDVLDQAGYKVHYNFFQNVWVNEKDEIDEHVIAWCEIPAFDKE